MANVKFVNGYSEKIVKFTILLKLSFFFFFFVNRKKSLLHIVIYKFIHFLSILGIKQFKEMSLFCFDFVNQLIVIFLLFRNVLSSMNRIIQEINYIYFSIHHNSNFNSKMAG